MTTARLGAAPTMREDLDRALALLAGQAEVIAAQGARISALEDQLVAAGDEDGPSPQPLPPQWKPIKAASALVGYSPTMLRKLNDGGRASWWAYRGSRIWIDTARCPRRV
jgi:hypothetical protein